MIGNIAISLIAGVAAFVALTALGVPFAVPLAFLVAVTDLIPLIGATLGALICIMVGAPLTCAAASDPRSMPRRRSARSRARLKPGDSS